MLNSFIGAITAQSAPVLVYSVDGQRVIQGSVITPLNILPGLGYMVGVIAFSAESA